MTPFIKLTHDLSDIQRNGFDESLFTTDYVALPPSIAAELNEWCLSNLPTIELKSKGADEDGATFYLLAFDKKNADTVASLRLKFSDIIRSVVFAVATRLKDGDCAGPETDDAFDELEAAVKLRTLVISLPTDVLFKKKNKEAILIYI